MLDHEAIWKAYPNIVNSCDTFVNYGLDKDGNKVYWEQSKVDAARNEFKKTIFTSEHERRPANSLQQRSG